MAKKLLSVLLCVLMLVGLCTVGVTVASADSEKVILHNFDTIQQERCAACLGAGGHEGCWAGVNWGDNYSVFHAWCQRGANRDPLNPDNMIQAVAQREGVSSSWYGQYVNAACAANRAMFYLPEGQTLDGVVGFGIEAYTDFEYDELKQHKFESVGIITPDLKEYALPYGQYFKTNEFKEIDLFGKTLKLVDDPSKELPTITLSSANFDGTDPIQVAGIVFYVGGSNSIGGGYTYYIDNFYYKVETETTAHFDVQGVDSIVADEDGKVVLPDASIEGKQFIGWADGNDNLYKAGETVTLEKSTKFNAVAAKVDLQTGAGIRWAKEEHERGIRFETYVTKDALDKIGSSKFELGALILPYKNYKADITVANSSSYGAVNVVDPKVYGEVGDNYRYYTGVVDFEKYFAVSGAVLADLKLTAVSYVKVTYSDGEVAYFYDHPDATDNVRTVSEVARAALADTDFGYSDDQIAILNLYNKYSAKTNVPSYRTDRLDKVGAVNIPETAQTYNMTEIMDSTRMIGRSVYKEEANTVVSDWTASGFEVGMVCKGDVTVDFSVVGNNGLLGLVVDEDFENMKTYKFVSSDTSATFDTNLDDGYHKLRVLKLNECDWQTNGITFKSITVKGVPTDKPAAKDLKIEVIGDSITSGWGILTNSTQNISSDQFGYYEDGSKTYAAQLAQKLNADINTVSRSGIGCLYGFGGSKMIDIYDQALPKTAPEEKWNFANYTPDLVIINLGTNDSSQAAQAGVLTYDNSKAAAQQLVDTVRAKYPNSTIVWVEGMMYNYNGNFSVPVREVLENAGNAYYCLVPTVNCGAADGHPTLDAHTAAANSIYDFLKENNIVD